MSHSFSNILELELSYERIYKPLNIRLTSEIVKESESKNYNACQFSLNNKNVIFREAKITPTKSGHFVTLWKRAKSGVIIPFDESDNIDLFVINVRSEDNHGQFVFSKSKLISEGILSSDGVKGKCAIRIYAPWIIVSSNQAIKTQSWQSNYFLDISSPLSPNELIRARELYHEDVDLYSKV